MSMEHILKAHTLTTDTPSGETNQPKEQWLGTPDDAIEPPLPLESLLALSDINTIRSAAIEAIALNTVGLGYQLVVAPGHEEEVADPTADITACRLRLESLARRDIRLERPSFTELLRAAKTDEEGCGNGSIEVSRDRRTGEISGFFHAPSIRVRRRADFDGYRMLPADGTLSNATRFMNFAEKVRYNRESGRPTNKLAEGAARWAWNEMLVFRIYNSRSRDYGLPRDHSMTIDYLADKLASESNVSFFDSSGTPPTLIFVQGEEAKDGGKMTFRVPRETTERIGQTIKNDGGHRTRVAIVPLPPGTKTDHIKLGEFSDRDVGFNTFRDNLSARTLAAFRLSSVFVYSGSGSSQSGRFTAEIERAITKEQLFDAEQSRWSDEWDVVLADLGFGHLKLKFNEIAIESDQVKRDSADKMAEHKTMTRREYRAAHGYGPLPEGTGSGHVAVGWNDELVEPKPVGTSLADNRGLQDGIGGRPSQNGADAAAQQKASVRKIERDPETREIVRIVEE